MKDQPGTSFPILSGPVIKAASSRCFIPYIADLAVRMDSGSLEHRHRRKVAEWLARLGTLFYSFPMFLDEDQHLQIEVAILKFSLHYSWLAQQASRQGMMHWNIVPKHHYVQHIGEQSSLINCRFTQCYKEESFVGRVTAIYAASANGRHEQTIQRTCLRKYLLGLQIWLQRLEAYV